MAYQNGTASSPINLLTQLVTFLAANGWTTDSSVADGTSSQGWRAHMHRSGVYANMRACMNESVWTGGQGSGPGYALALYLGTGYNGANAWDAQAGGPIGSGVSTTVGVGMNLVLGAITGYHFFADATGDNVCVVVENTPGIFRHLGFGVSFLKAGTITGGAYFFGSSSGWGMAAAVSASPGSLLTAQTPTADFDAYSGNTSYLRADVDAFTGKWLSFGQNTFSGSGYTGKKGWGSCGANFGQPTDIPNYDNFKLRQVSVMNGMANLLPLRIYAERDVSGYSLLGSIPGVFFSNGVGLGFSSGSDYVLGADTYKMFPNFAVKKV